jgi:kinesin family protein C1
MALQVEIERATMTVSAMKAELEIGRQRAREAEEQARKSAEETESDARGRIREVEEELRAAESIRRKLHNQVQELKGVWWEGLSVQEVLMGFREYKGFCAG